MRKIMNIFFVMVFIVFFAIDFHFYHINDKGNRAEKEENDTIYINKDYDNNVDENSKKQEEEKEKENSYDPMIMLVNRDHSLDASFKPLNLVKPYIYQYHSITEEEKYMEYEAAKAVEKLVEGAESDGIMLYGLSGYRSYETQQAVFDNNVAKDGLEYAQKYVAQPGQSEHQTGLAMDFATVNGFVEEGSIEAKWLMDNSYIYGCIVRYPKGKEDITGINYEPWHVRYVGMEAAKEIYEKDITFEEYFGY